MLGEFGGLVCTRRATSTARAAASSPTSGRPARQRSPTGTWAGAGQPEPDARQGLSASIYTEITDLEGELNGFLTYDRQVTKMDQARVRAANLALINASKAIGSSAPVALPVNSRRSLQVTTPGFTNRYLRHRDSLAYTEVVDAASSSLLKADATYTIRPAWPAPVATRSSRSTSRAVPPPSELPVRNSPDDGSALLRADATWARAPG
ncbi:AbfB domain-containing protein [Micromonospora sp. M12]